MKGIHLVVCVCLFLFVFNQFLFADKTMESDSLYTYKYINGIYMSEPERALNLLEGAESKKTLPLRIINELRSKAYRNMYMTKLAFVYARKSYLLDSISQKDPKHLLKMTVDLAELALLMSDHKESMRYIKERRVSCCFVLVKINGNYLSRKRRMIILTKLSNSFKVRKPNWKWLCFHTSMG